MRVRRDVRIEKPRFAIAKTYIGILELNSAVKDALDFGSGQRGAGFILRGDVIIVKRRAVRRQNFLFGRYCHYACSVNSDYNKLIRCEQAPETLLPDQFTGILASIRLQRTFSRIVESSG